ncbi:PhzF family phenazine biosynthesis protein [Gallaecimonas xiamenensis]|uniref:PhzF family phenazine biosynthesis protein n=1 Tax=Gallaecimonas xiamenensis 3-C-1 TaxID=745411 RepID=K2IYF0_9GAMM|nr:PhzF family phenazine biosynthesis protein [Gallaecimonas xiamenensis]EKE75501.1 PhzF family phenazine biosynthesis protein [Gallaecimonas xiamenensis 3-C-1]
MQELDISIIDAFTGELFRGNPAAVICTEQPLAAELMQAIATENNLSETAFLVPGPEGRHHIRWFSPITEIAFCGHATLASAFVLFKQNPEQEALHFYAKAVGNFSVTQTAKGKIQMDFPSRKPLPLDAVPADLLAGLSIAPLEVLRNGQAYFVVYGSEADVRAVSRDNAALARLKPFDVVVTSRAQSGPYDFVSRYFWPANGGDEDPVTGSIHTGLAPFWAERLGKTTLLAYQASPRGGVLECQVLGDRVQIAGQAVPYLTGRIRCP